MFSKSSTYIHLTLVALVVMLASARVALADDPLAKPSNAVAREHLSAGNKLYRVREFDKAVDEYKAGALKQDVPVFHYNLGQCYRQLGRYEEAIWHYERFLDRGMPVGELNDAVQAFIAQMKSELDKKAMTQPPVEPAPDGKQAPRQQMPPPESPQPTGAGQPWYNDTIGWGLAGGGVVGVGVSGGLLLSAMALDEDANAELSQTRRNELHASAGSRRTIGAIVSVGGVGLLVAGVVKLVIHPSSSRERLTSWTVGATANGIQVFGMF